MIHLTPIGPWSEKMETSEIRTAATSRNAKLLAVGDKSHTIKLLRRDLAHRTDALHSVAKRRTFRVELSCNFYAASRLPNGARASRSTEGTQRRSPA